MSKNEYWWKKHKALHDGLLKWRADPRSGDFGKRKENKYMVLDTKFVQEGK